MAYLDGEGLRHYHSKVVGLINTAKTNLQTDLDELSADTADKVEDVKVNGTSVVSTVEDVKVANIPVASANAPGVVKVNSDYGVTLNQADGQSMTIVKAGDTQIKAGTYETKAIVPANQHASVFYGLAKAAGDTTQAASDNAVGTYTNIASDKIRTMIDAAAKYETEAISSNVGIVPYWGPGGTSDGNTTPSQRGEIVTLNGTNTSTVPVKIVLSGMFRGASNNNYFKESYSPRTVPVKGGHTYKLSVEHINGECAATSNLYSLIFIEGSDTEVAAARIGHDGYWTPQQDIKIMVGLSASANSEFTNYSVRVRLIDTSDGLASDLRNLRSDLPSLINEGFEIDITDYPSVNCTISSSNKATRELSKYVSSQIPADDYGAVKFTANAEKAGVISFLKTAIPGDIANQTDLTEYLATGETGRHLIEAGETESFTMPEDTKYIFISRISNSEETIPENITASARIVSRLAKAEANIQNTYSEFAPVIVNTVSGDIASFDDGAEAAVRGGIVNITPVQTGSGDPSPADPENIRPISGFTGIKVAKVRKNLWSMKSYVGVAYNPSIGSSFTMTESAVQPVDKGNGLFEITLATWGKVCFLIPVKPHQTLRFMYSREGTGGRRTHGYLDKYMKVLTNNSQTDSSENINTTFTVNNENAAYIYFVYATNTEGTITLSNPMLTYDSTDTVYEPYQGDLYDITFPVEAGEVCNGYIDIARRKLVVTSKLMKINEISSWVWYASGGYYRTNSTLTSINCTGNVIASEIYKTVSVHTSGDNDYTCGSNGSLTSGRISIKDNRYINDVTNWLAAVGDTKLVVKLVTPLEYDIDLPDIRTMLGSNRIFTDISDISIDYIADTKMYIDGLTRPTEDDMTANNNIAAGKYFSVDHRLFLATAAIAVGEMIKPGVNCTEVSVADALNAILAQ